MGTNKFLSWAVLLPAATFHGINARGEQPKHFRDKVQHAEKILIIPRAPIYYREQFDRAKLAARLVALHGCFPACLNPMKYKRKLDMSPRTRG